MVELRNDIKQDLEKSKGFEIDKKTLKRIVDKLLRDGLVKTVDFLVTLEAAEGNGVQSIVKTLVLDPDVNEQEAQLMLNPTIANPTNRQGAEKAAKQEQPPKVPNRYSLRRRSEQVKYKEEESVPVASSGDASIM